MVDEKFREKLDGFLERALEYNLGIYGLKREILPKIINEQTEKIFKTNTEGVHVDVHITYRENRTQRKGTYGIIERLISQTDPMSAFSKHHPKAEILDFSMTFGQTPASSDDITKFDEFWESCLQEMKQDKDYSSILKKTKEIFEEAIWIKKELVKRIEEPWKI